MGIGVTKGKARELIMFHTRQEGSNGPVTSDDPSNQCHIIDAFLVSCALCQAIFSPTFAENGPL